MRRRELRRTRRSAPTPDLRRSRGRSSGLVRGLGEHAGRPSRRCVQPRVDGGARAGMNRIRLTVVETHPVQYNAPWYRYVAQHCHEIDLTVLYASRPTPSQQAVDFRRPFQWDTRLLDGYRSRVVRESRPDDRFDSDSYRGLDVPEIGAALLETQPHVALIAGWHSVTQMRAMTACRANRVPVLYRGDSHLGTRPGGVTGLLWRVKTRALRARHAPHIALGQR